MEHSEVFVIGAGPAGLTAAYLLTKAGVATTVIEADPIYVGGISRTVNYKGFLFDIGGHRFFSKSKEVVDLWNEILPDDFIERPRLSRIYYDGKFFAYPLKAFEALSNLGVFESTHVRAVVRLQAGVPQREPRELPRVGDEPVRRPAVLDLLQDLHREGVGHELRRDLRRLGRAAHQGPRPVERHRERAAPLDQGTSAGRAAGRQGHQDADRHLPLSAPGPGHDVGGGRRQDQGAGRRRSTWARKLVEPVAATPAARLWTIDASTTAEGRAHLHRAARHLVGADARADGIDRAGARLARRGREAALPRLPHGRADRRQAATSSPTTGSTSTSRA